MTDSKPNIYTFLPQTQSDNKENLDIQNCSLKTSEKLIEMRAFFAFLDFQRRIKKNNETEIINLIRDELLYNENAYTFSVFYLDTYLEYVSKDKYKKYIEYHKLWEQYKDYEDSDFEKIPAEHQEVMFSNEPKLNSSYDFEAIEFDETNRVAIIKKRRFNIKEPILNYPESFYRIVSENYERLKEGKSFKLYEPNGQYILFDSNLNYKKENDGIAITYNTTSDQEEYYFVAYRLLYEKHLLDWIYYIENTSITKTKTNTVDKNTNKKYEERVRDILLNLNELGLNEFLSNSDYNEKILFSIIMEEEKKQLLPFMIALLSKIGFLDYYLQKKIYKKTGYKELAKILNSNPRRVAGNIRVLNPNSEEKSYAYTSKKYVDLIEKKLKHSKLKNNEDGLRDY